MSYSVLLGGGGGQGEVTTVAMTSQLPFNSRPDILTSLVGIMLTGSVCEGQGWRGGGGEEVRSAGMGVCGGDG